MQKHAILKKKILLIALSLLCLFTSAKTTLFAQTANSTETDEARRVALVAALERAQAEVRTGRKYIDSLEESVKAKQAQIKALDERDETRVRIQNLLQIEIKELRAAIDAQKEALRIKKIETEYLQGELKKAQKKLKSSHTREKFFVGTTALLFLLLLL